MTNNLIFDNAWMKKSHPKASWALDVIEGNQNNGKTYLQEISNWFSNYPGTNKRKNGLKAGLLSSDNFSHLGAVNELSWWAYLSSRNVSISPISEGKKPTPDFEAKLDGNTITFEVTTINASAKEECQDLENSQNNSLYRLLNKAAKDKLPQIKYGHKRNYPVVLVIFNCDEWSGFGTSFSNCIESYLNKHILPNELSVILYLERHVIDGKSMYKNSGTLLYLNPRADIHINETVFNSLLGLEDGWSQCEKA